MHQKYCFWIPLYLVVFACCFIEIESCCAGFQNERVSWDSNCPYKMPLEKMIMQASYLIDDLNELQAQYKEHMRISKDLYDEGPIIRIERQVDDLMSVLLYREDEIQSSKVAQNVLDLVAKKSSRYYAKKDLESLKNKVKKPLITVQTLPIMCDQDINFELDDESRRVVSAVSESEYYTESEEEDSGCSSLISPMTERKIE